MRWLLVVESAFFTAAAGYLFIDGWFWLAWPFVILALVYARMMGVAWEDWEANRDVRELAERTRP